MATNKWIPRRLDTHCSDSTKHCSSASNAIVRSIYFTSQIETNLVIGLYVNSILKDHQVTKCFTCWVPYYLTEEQNIRVEWWCHFIINTLRVSDGRPASTLLGANRHTTSITISTTDNFLYYEEGMSPLSILFCRYKLLSIQAVGDP